MSRFPAIASGKETTFGELVSTVSTNNKKVQKREYLECGRFPVVDQGQQFIGGYCNDESKVISEDLPLLVFGDHTRTFKYLDQPFVPGADGVKVLKPLGVSAKWLYHIAHALDFPDKGYARHFQHLKNAKLRVPPLPDQRRIVEEIEKQFSHLEVGVAALRRVQANLKRYRAAVLKAACEGRLVPTEAELAAQGRASVAGGRMPGATANHYETGEQLLARILADRRKNWHGRGKYKEPAAPDTADLPPLPEGWVWASPSQLSSADAYALAIGPFGSNLKVSDYTDAGVPLVFVRNIRSGQFGGERTVFVSASKANELRAHHVSAGEILVTKMGEPPGEACLYPDSATDAVITADCIKLRLTPNLLQKRFFVHAINSDVVKPQIQLITKGVAQMKISLGRFSSLAIPMPPLSEQTRIVDEVERRLSVIEKLEATVAANLQRAARLRQSILQRAFFPY
ncbi:MAG TPA: restriction endonuclease subunit S [Rudaea sp.]|nr:restriction endonuclease subunit S [Rudaea sp.]